MTDIRLLIVDDIPPVRRELHGLLDLAGHVQVIGEAADGAEAVRLSIALQPDVVLMDLEMPVLDGFAAARQIKALLPSCRLIALSIHEEAATRLQALQAGFDAFIPKGAGLQDLLDALVPPAVSPSSSEPKKGATS